MTFVSSRYSQVKQKILSLVESFTAMMPLIKNKVLDPTNTLPVLSIQSYKRLPGSVLTLFRPGGSLGTSQRFLSITLRALEVIL